MKKLSKLIFAAAFVAWLFVFASISAFAMPARPGSGITDGTCKSHAGELVSLEDIPSVNSAKIGKKAFAPSLNKTAKNIPLAIIVIGFDNAPYDNSVDWGNRIFMQNQSLSAYYSDMSFGQFTFEPAKETSKFNEGGNTNVGDKLNDGIVHVQSSYLHSDWIDLEDDDEILSLNSVLIDAVNKAADYIDFAAYDADGDGVIENNEFALGFVFGGYEASVASSFKKHGRSTYLWSHAYSIGENFEDLGMEDASPAPGGVKVSNYIAIAEIALSNKDVEEIAPMNTFAHELGHYLGLPDLYDTSYNTSETWGSYDVDALSVMASGCWGIDINGDYTPYTMDPWSRCVLGWYEPKTVTGSGEYALKAQSYNSSLMKYEGEYEVIKIPTGRSNEYYLAENRQFSGWDEGMSLYYGDASESEGGIVFWHIDDDVYDEYNPTNEVNDTFHRPAVMPLFVEYTKLGKATLIGSVPDTENPFFSLNMINKLLPDLQGAVDLPLYAEGREANTPSERTLSGIKVAPLNDSGFEMNVNIITSIVPDVPDAPDTPDEPDVPDDSSSLCPFCGKTHNGNFVDKIVGFIHKILYFFKTLFKLG